MLKGIGSAVRTGVSLAIIGALILVLFNYSLLFVAQDGQFRGACLGQKATANLEGTIAFIDLPAGFLGDFTLAMIRRLASNAHVWCLI